MASLDLKIITTAPNEPFGLSFYNPSSMNIDWGDGSGWTTVPDTTGTWTSMSSSYLVPNTYTVKVSGYGCHGFQVYQVPSASVVYTLVEILTPFPNWNLKNLQNAFEFCGGISSLPSGLFDNNPNIVTFFNSFAYCTGLMSIPIGLFDNIVSTSLLQTFFRCTSLTAIPEGLFDNDNITDFGGTFRSCTSLSGFAPTLWNRDPEPIGYQCFRGCINLENYARIPTYWGGLGFRGYVEVEPTSSIAMPSITAGPFIVNVNVGEELCVNQYELQLCSYGSNSYSYYSISDQEDLHLIPHWRFLDTNGTIISSITLTDWTTGFDGNYTSAVFYYIDDMPTWNQTLCLNVEMKNTCSSIDCCDISGSSMSAVWSVMIPVSVGEWTPQYIKYTSDGILDISAKWTEHPIKWYATLHEELSSPIIFSQSFNLTSNLASVTSEFCPLTIEVLAFDKAGNYGWADGSCITNISSISASITGNAYIISSYNDISGTSNEFKIRPFEQPFEIRRQNESWDATKSIKSYAMAPHLNSKYNLWDNFIGHSIGQLSAGQQLGRKSYERIANFPANHIDIDESNIKQLYSISQYLDVPIDNYDLNYPPELQRLLDIGSISHSKLWGEIVKCDLNITDNQICPRCGYKHSNLGDMIEDPFNYTVTAGVPFIQHDRFNISPEGWSIEYPPLLGYFGKTWITILPSISAAWTIPSLNYDGQYQIIGQYGGFLYTSNDYGNNWVLNTSAPSGDWIGTAISENGQYQLAANGELYSSSDYGVTWYTTPVNLGCSWNIAINSTGQYRAVTGNGTIYVSNNYGSTWTPILSSNIEGGNTNLSWWSMNISDDGKYMLTCAEGNYIYSSNDYGVTWVRDYNIEAGWRWSSMSSSGQHRMAVTNSSPGPNKKVYISNNYGISWFIADLPDSNNGWRLSTMDKSGKFMMVGDDDNVYISYDYGATWQVDGQLEINNQPHMGISGNGIYQIVGDTNTFYNPPPLNNFYALRRNLEIVPITNSNKTLCGGNNIEVMLISTYPFMWISKQYNMFGHYIVDFCSQYDYYEYKGGFPLLETCDPLDPRHIQAAGVINRNDEYNTLKVESLSSVEDWFGDEGKLQEIIEYELLRGLQLSTQTCSISS